MPVEIRTEGDVVWVNSVWCLALFSLYGMEVLESSGKFTVIRPEKYIHGGAPAMTTRQDWSRWVVYVRQIHGVEVSDKYMPARLCAEKPSA